MLQVTNRQCTKQFTWMLLVWFLQKDPVMYFPLLPTVKPAFSILQGFNIKEIHLLSVIHCINEGKFMEARQVMVSMHAGIICLIL